MWHPIEWCQQKFFNSHRDYCVIVLTIDDIPDVDGSCSSDEWWMILFSILPDIDNNETHGLSIL
jgi:hypothetical protein